MHKASTLIDFARDMLDVVAFSCSSEIHFSKGPSQPEMFSERSGNVLSDMLENVTGKKEAYFFEN